MGGQLDAGTVRALFTELSDRLAAAGVSAHLFVVGGAAMALAYDPDRVTRDVDALFIPAPEVRQIAKAMSAGHGLEADGSMTPAEARAQANAEAKGQAVLHGPDQVAGGNPKQFTGLGDTGVNSSFGNQWGAGRAEMLSAKMEAKLDELGIPESLWGDVRMNVRLNVNHTVPGGV